MYSNFTHKSLRNFPGHIMKNFRPHSTFTGTLDHLFIGPRGTAGYITWLMSRGAGKLRETCELRSYGPLLSSAACVILYAEYLGLACV